MSLPTINVAGYNGIINNLTVNGTLSASGVNETGTADTLPYFNSLGNLTSSIITCNSAGTISTTGNLSVYSATIDTSLSINGNFTIDSSGDTTINGNLTLAGTTDNTLTYINSSGFLNSSPVTCNSSGNISAVNNLTVNNATINTSLSVNGNFTVDSSGDTAIAGNLTLAGTSNNTLTYINSAGVVKSSSVVCDSSGDITTTGTIKTGANSFIPRMYYYNILTSGSQSIGNNSTTTMIFNGTATSQNTSGNLTVTSNDKYTNASSVVQLWQISVFWQAVNGGASSAKFSTQVIINGGGSYSWGEDDYPPAGQGMNTSTSVTLLMNPADYFTIGAYQNSGGSITVSECAISIVQIQ